MPWLPSETTWIPSNISFLDSDSIGLKVSLIFISAQSIVPTWIFQTGIPNFNSDRRSTLQLEIRSSLVGKRVVSQMGLSTMAWRM